ncbi:MAG: IPT/TIG domain-containing protein [Patescibacteria group bacterium]|nr:IPT/TIG domain-containing protein [Patescibacteria group bacterium]
MKKLKLLITQGLFVALLSLALYQPIVLVLELLTTEFFLLFIRISTEVKTLVLFLILLLIVFSKKIISALGQAKTQKTVMLVFVFSLVIGFTYHKYWLHLQKYPRIYSKEPDWTIQGSKIVIEGKNFGQAYEIGEVYLDDIKLESQYWTNYKIIAKQPVTDDYGKHRLYVKRQDGFTSNKIEHIVKNPGEIND